MLRLIEGAVGGQGKWGAGYSVWRFSVDLMPELKGDYYAGVPKILNRGACNESESSHP